jgi:hypothetical protein
MRIGILLEFAACIQEWSKPNLAVRFKGYQSGRKMCIGFTPLQAEDIADIIHFVVSRPYHVNIADLIVSTAQASSTIVKESEVILY